MLNFLKYFSWLLVIFGVIAFIAVALGLKPGVGTVQVALSVIGLQVVFPSLVLFGFTLHSKGKLSRTSLLYGGWLLLVVLFVITQIWFSTSEINI